MYYIFLGAIFLLGFLSYAQFSLHTKSVERLVKKFDSREKELLDRLMYSVGKPFNLPARERPLSEEKDDEEPPDYNWKDF